MKRLSSLWWNISSGTKMLNMEIELQLCNNTLSLAALAATASHGVWCERCCCCCTQLIVEHKLHQTLSKYLSRFRFNFLYFQPFSAPGASGIRQWRIGPVFCWSKTASSSKLLCPNSKSKSPSRRSLKERGAGTPLSIDQRQRDVSKLSSQMPTN